MKLNRAFQFRFLGSTLMLGALACGGGGGGGGSESFIVTGVWSLSGSSSAGTPSPSDDSPAGRICSAAAAGAGALPASQINVVQQDGTVTANEVGSTLEFAGTVNSGNQSFQLDSTTPICQRNGACEVCGALGLDFRNAAGNTADVNVALVANGNSACPIQCTITFPPLPGTRS
jgi:hypothetical protein